MHVMNTKRADLNLLNIFHAVAETGSVSKAAVRLHLSQPAISHALNRLRHLTGDALFVRSGKGLAMTPHAAQMRVSVQKVISAAQDLVSPAAFNPQTDARIFKVGASDYSSLTLIPALAHRLRELAPHCALEVAQVGETMLAQLESGRIDCSYWGTEAPGEPFLTQRLLSEKLVGVLSASHPLAAKAKKGRVSLMTTSHSRMPSSPCAIPAPTRSRVNWSGSGFRGQSHLSVKALPETWLRWDIATKSCPCPPALPVMRRGTG